MKEAARIFPFSVQSSRLTRERFLQVSAAKRWVSRARCRFPVRPRVPRSDVVRSGRRTPLRAPFKSRAGAGWPAQSMTLQLVSCVSTRRAHVAFLQLRRYLILFFRSRRASPVLCNRLDSFPRLRAAAFPRSAFCFIPNRFVRCWIDLQVLLQTKPGSGAHGVVFAGGPVAGDGSPPSGGHQGAQAQPRPAGAASQAM